MDCRDVWGSPIESVVLDYHRINGALLDSDAFLRSAWLGQGTLSSLADTALVRVFAYLYLISPVHDHECSGSAGSIDEGGKGVLDSAVLVSVTVGAPGDPGSFLRNDVEPNEGG